VIQLRLATEDLERMRFDYSPIVEVVQSGRMVNAGHSRPPFENWFAEARGRLAALDTELLAVLLPDTPVIANCLLVRPRDHATIDDQLHAIAQCPPEQLRADLLDVWPDARPARLRELLADPVGAPRRVADLLCAYWESLIEPHWRRIKATLRDDVAYRATQLAQRGVDGMLTDLHHELSMSDGTLVIDKPRHDIDHQVGGAGVRLVPSAFSWPQLIVSAQPGEPADLTYGCRGTAAIWDADVPEDALGDLLGRGRAAILRLLGRPRGTSDLATELGLTAPAVSQHLAVLRRAGMVTSWRSGRRVLYQRSALATSIVAVNEDVPAVAPYRRS
jgi:DNA-binding transcriptional ArsR family regulator